MRSRMVPGLQLGYAKDRTWSSHVSFKGIYLSRATFPRNMQSPSDNAGPVATSANLSSSYKKVIQALYAGSLCRILTCLINPKFSLGMRIDRRFKRRTR